MTKNLFSFACKIVAISFVFAFLFTVVFYLKINEEDVVWEFYNDSKIVCFKDNPMLDGNSGSCYIKQWTTDGAWFWNLDSITTCQFSFEYITTIPQGCWG